VIDVLDGEIKLVVVMLRIAAIFSAAIRQHPAQRDSMLFEERQARSFRISAAVIGVLRS
jgi:hypothetical protein